MQVNIEVAKEEGGAVRGAGGPCGAEVIHPRRVAGGDVHSIHEEVPSTGDELECHEVQGEDMHGLHLEPLMVLLPKESDSSLPLSTQSHDSPKQISGIGRWLFSSQRQHNNQLPFGTSLSLQLPTLHRVST
jgi:hypothetical protein